MEGSTLGGKELSAESRTGVGSSDVRSYWKCFAIKIEGSSGRSGKGASWARVYMVTVLFMLGADAVVVAAVAARAYSLRRCW